VFSPEAVVLGSFDGLVILPLDSVVTVAGVFGLVFSPFTLLSEPIQASQNKISKNEFDPWRTERVRILRKK